MRYDPKKIEARWQKKWLAGKIYEPDFRAASGRRENALSASRRKPFYNLMMFPYPSAEGLHIGGMRTFTGVDIYGRLKRMQGYDVFEPIGLDAFGIHSENYALKTGRHPMKQAEVLEKNYYRQLAMMGNGFAWDERLETNDPEYYKWTQWIFLQMFKAGLAYRKKAEVNWCPSCKTVLADEQVIAGACERCGTAVIKKELEQWFFKITDYAERLLQNLEKIDWSPRVKTAQKNWIGKSEGALIKFNIRSSQYMVLRRPYIEVFTTRPDTLFGATYVVLGPEHPLLQNQELGIKNQGEVAYYIKQARAKKNEERMAEGKEKTGVEVKGVRTINPANNEELPVWVADYVLGNVGTGAIMAVPAHDQRDFEFAKKYSLPVTIVVCPNYPEKTCPLLTEAYAGEGHLVGSGKFDGMRSEDARRGITDFVKGKWTIQYRLRDWLISRQRYWGPPIPVIFCEHCKKLLESSKFQVPSSKFSRKYSKGERKNPGWIAVPEKDLPVKLPYVKNFRPTGTDQSPLASVEKFYKVRCPHCRAWARRETDVSDTFLDSAWYFLRYPSAKNTKTAWDPAITKKWLPVDSYIGGAEHSVLHLMYSRFLTMALHDAKLLDFDEPFPRFRAHGLITKDSAKMSKSKGNVVSPDEYVRAYGADAVRMYLAFMAPFEQDGDFQDTGIRGITRFLDFVWKFIHKEVPYRPEHALYSSTENVKERSRIFIQYLTHKTMQKVTEDIENLKYNTAISTLMVYLNNLDAYRDVLTDKKMKISLKIFLRLLAPFAPFITEELWRGVLKEKTSIHSSAWPKYNPKLLQEGTFELVIQINGKVRGRAEMAVGASEQEAKKAARDIEAIAAYLLASGEPKKIIFVPNKLINFVV